MRLERDAKQTIIGCAVGGMLCSAVAFMVAPEYWWLGLLAGIAGGYAAYEFKEFCAAIPAAFEAAGQGVAKRWKETLINIGAWFAEPHPFYYPAAVVAVPPLVWFAWLAITALARDGAPVVVMIVLPLVFFVFFDFAVDLVALPFMLLAFIGARMGERRYWYPFLCWEPDSHTSRETVKQLDAKGYHAATLTHRNAFRWMGKGLLITLKFFVWTLWKYLGIGLWRVLRFSWDFLRHLITLVHSRGRVLCATYGTLGGAVAYLWLASPDLALGQKVLVVALGGLLGAGFGLLARNLIAHRILHVRVDGA